jgi:hypothetical protein
LSKGSNPSRHQKEEPFIPAFKGWLFYRRLGMLEGRSKKKQRRNRMNQETLEHAENWAVATFGAAELGDPRRTDRLVKVASALAKNPSASLPHASETWGETLGAYRFLNNPTLGYEDIIMPHWTQTYHDAAHCARTLLLADTTEIDFSTHSALEGLAPKGLSRENIGFSVHTVLAMNPQTRAYPGMFDPRTLPAQTRSERGDEGTAAQTRPGMASSGSTVCNTSDACQSTASGSPWAIAAAMSSRIAQYCEQLGSDFVLRVAPSSRH